MMGVELRFMLGRGVLPCAGAAALARIFYADTKRIQIVFAKAVAKPAYAAI